MLTKPIPLWITIGGLLLTSGAGYINAVGFLGLSHQPISHMSGIVSNLGIELVHGDQVLALRAAATLLFFFLGCVLSGLIIRQSALQLGRRYGVALTCEFALLLAATHFLRHGNIAGDYLAAMACGLQNAMATSYSGAVVRTTHMTGIITDLGIALGLAARREPADWRRMRLYSVLLTGFFTGGILGAMGYASLGNNALLVPAALCGLIGIGYMLLDHFKRSTGS